MGNRFGGFGSGGNMQAMMRQAQKMQQDAMRAKEELENTVFEGTAGGGLVKVEINGKFDMLSIKIDAEAAADDVEMLEDLVMAAFNDAKAKVDDKKEKSLGMLGGLV